MNMEQIFDKWHNKVQCPTGKSGASSIDYVNFLYVFIICWVGAALAFIWEICQLRCAPPRCYRTVRPHAPAPICYAMHNCTCSAYATLLMPPSPPAQTGTA